MDAPPSIDTHDGRSIRLDESPSVTATDEWLLELGCQKTIVGKTLQDRDITLYWMDYSNPASSPTKSVLFLSLVHGNEPMGLVSLLMGAKELASSHVEPPPGKVTTASMRIYFLPIVNVDAYELNLGRGEERGCHRPNLRTTCKSILGNNNATTAAIVAESCIPPTFGYLGRGGVDLNRNFPTDWEALPNTCSHNYPGPHPLSEPETQAIVRVVEDFNITHAMSLHSRASLHSGANEKNHPLIIHPFTSERRFETMKKKDANRFRKWSSSMNRNVDAVYVTGTARKAIKYTAGGTTIDWMYSEKHITSFVLEVIPPCESRWCLGNNVYQNAEPNALTMKHFVSLVIDEKDNDTSVQLLLLLLLLSGIMYSIVKWRHNFRLFLYRSGLSVFLKEKEDVSQEAIVEISPLNV